MSFEAFRGRARKSSVGSPGTRSFRGESHVFCDFDHELENLVFFVSANSFSE